MATYARPRNISDRVLITPAIAGLGIANNTPGTVVGVFGRDAAWRIVVRVADDAIGSQDFELAPTAVADAP